MANVLEFATESVEGVRFSFMSEVEAEKLSFKKITSPHLINDLGRPVPDGLYDPTLGPLDETTCCKTCGQRYFSCPGHFGHIDLVSVVYNPLLFNTLVDILRKTCFYCLHFKSAREEVEICLLKLTLITKGDVVGSKNVDMKLLYSSMIELSDDENDEPHSDGSYRKLHKQEWTSLQLNEAHSVLRDFLKHSTLKCRNCEGKGPYLKKPTFGWIHMSGMSDANIRANIIKGCKLGGEVFGGDDDNKSMSAGENDDVAVHGEVDASNGDEIATKKKRKTLEEEPHVEFLEQKKMFTGSMLPSTAKEIIRHLWENESELCSFICNIEQQKACGKSQSDGYSMFFLKRLPVPPMKFRPPAKQADSVMEHPQTVLLAKILEANTDLGNGVEKDIDHSGVLRCWMNLQQSINVYFDSKTAASHGQRNSSMGICQLLEKKEGLFRQKMMGKRVNFACRSVISPDPYLAVNEIGIPPAFALKLTYPERVTPWNVMKLREAVVNGPDNHPGATNFIDGHNSIRLLGKEARVAVARKLASSRGAITEAGRSSGYDLDGKVVLRHIRDGDAVLANRQPTLHKPSICGFLARVLPGEKTIRMHYVNCDSFNADFDGDEINVHFPQDEISRAEAYNIVNADYQYIVPTRGDPKRGLIQDHVVGAVLLTKRDTFLTWNEFSQLLYSSGLSSSESANVNLKPGCKVSVIDSEDLVPYLPPTILKPQRLWTGKQVVTAILKHIAKGKPFTMMKSAKIARGYFGKDDTKGKDPQVTKTRMIKGVALKEGHTESVDEDVVFVYKNEMLQGVIDKEQFGKHGLVHTVQELFGSNAAGTLLSVLSRALTSFLQFHGFTCGVDDLLLSKDYENQRKQLLQACQSCGDEVHTQFIGCKGKQMGSEDIKVEIEKAIQHNGDAAVTLLDTMMRNKIISCSSALNEHFPRGLAKPFQSNWLSQMTLSGAKGGTFNFQQISLMLGQQVLEGKGVPRMVSGKTLPCYPPWDTTPRAGGFISDRFLSGLRPQEFYFHCMGGREGLVDTAVKTSRSGYLQRCLIKNMESLKVHYDYTVRDSDGSIIQFYYGEDGIDVHKKSFIEDPDEGYGVLALNRKIVQDGLVGESDVAHISDFIEDNQYCHHELDMKAEDFFKDERKAKMRGIRRKKRKDFVKLLKSKYLMSLAQPGEPVGVIAAQSIGEPSTQMTLNTFHQAGRGEMNVTLGIPRLQEIVMTASSNIRTPTMTCPLRKGKSRDNAEQLAAKMRRVCVADLIENTQVSSLPFTASKSGVYTLYKLQMKLYGPESYPPHTNISVEDCQETLEYAFMRQLEDAIEKHMQLLTKIRGVADFTHKPGTGTSNGTNDNCEGNKSHDSSDDDDAANEEGGDDLGTDLEKHKKQAMDDIDYDDASDNEFGEALGTDGGDNEDNHSEKDDDDDMTRVQSKSSESSRKVKPEAKRRKPKSTKKKKSDRAIYVSCDGLHLEAHFRFSVDEPHVMLAQIVEKTARKVAIKSCGNIDQCKVVETKIDEESAKNNSRGAGIPMLREGKESRMALQAAGADFTAFWELQDELDVNWISTNDVCAVLRTYGIEAARATLITEIYRVFNPNGNPVDVRHLMLVADFMTHTGEYRSMSRIGGIADSNSPFARMCFETASRFIVQAATHREMDHLETPSARVCLGLPAKVGTGCFDVLYNVDYGTCDM